MPHHNMPHHNMPPHAVQGGLAAPDGGVGGAGGGRGGAVEGDRATVFAPTAVCVLLRRPGHGGACWGLGGQVGLAGDLEDRWGLLGTLGRGGDMKGR